MSLWDKSQEECESILENYFENVEKMFGKKVDSEVVEMMIGRILDQKIMNFTESTFEDLTPKTLIQLAEMMHKGWRLKAKPGLIIEPTPIVDPMAEKPQRGRRKKAD
jgi:hypothetical protein